jgi:hypothetical protein
MLIGVFRSHRSLRKTPVAYPDRDTLLPMAVGRVLGPLQDAIYPDVAKVYEEGLNPAVEASVFLVLAPLAETVSEASYDGRGRYYGDVIKELLLAVFESSLPNLSKNLNLGSNQLLEGMKELFGLGEQPLVGELGVRREHASPFFCFKNGETLRRGKRKGEDFIGLILDEIVYQLAVIADEEGFTLEEQLHEAQNTETPLDAIQDKSQLLNGVHALRALQLGRALFYELHRVCSNGIETVMSENSIPYLTALAKKASHAQYDTSDASIDDLERVLNWAIGRFDDSRQIRGARDLFGLGDARGLESSMRYEHAARHFGHESGTRFIESSKEVWVITFIRDYLIRLAGQMEFWPVDEPPGTFF